MKTRHFFPQFAGLLLAVAASTGAVVAPDSAAPAKSRHFCEQLTI